ncbi:hypothetical protein pneo_cds_994 [Pandoravirus neocaledonia]|uniref:Ankyrin repeat domain containing protein n=1 Tax=Pandoravirus neocaledonia TaxID=2107708 RepID=A0A2U7UDR2_9VIRU|nr:hypothetical protein pneo_cds_994 [Pandoravirus neocaledonia]AVK76601.1 hypothetical protein pneo_cds_994 [Pandoravirus neocaledonia]
MNNSVHNTLGLADMPAEVIAHITSFLERGRDLAAWHRATGVAIADALLRAVSDRCWSHSDACDMISLGAPLDVVKILAADLKDMRLKRLVTMACGGRVDVVEWFCDRAVRPSPDRRNRRARADSSDDSDDDCLARCDDCYKRFCKAVYYRRKRRPDCDSRVVGHALVEAADHGHGAVVEWLLTECDVDEHGPSHMLLDYLSVDAARRGFLGVVKAIHAYTLSISCTAHCLCPRSALSVAIAHDRVDVVAWMRAARCNLTSPCTCPACKENNRCA